MYNAVVFCCYCCYCCCFVRFQRDFPNVRLDLIEADIVFGMQRVCRQRKLFLFFFFSKYINSILVLVARSLCRFFESLAFNSDIDYSLAIEAIRARALAQTVVIFKNKTILCIEMKHHVFSSLACCIVLCVPEKHYMFTIYEHTSLSTTTTTRDVIDFCANFHICFSNTANEQRKKTAAVLDQRRFKSIHTVAAVLLIALFPHLSLNTNFIFGFPFRRAIRFVSIDFMVFVQ